jgi:VWFA-related protein
MTVDQLLALHHSETEHVRMVTLEASVTNRRGRVVRGLEKQDFRLFEDQVPQDIAVFSSEGAEPLSLAFLLDVSGSMRDMDKLRLAKNAIRTLVERLRPEDRFALIRFADEQVTWVTDFTQDRAQFLQSLDTQEGYGRTALVDALAAAPHLVQDRIATRKAIVLITDGADNFSRTPLADAVTLARRVNVPLFTIVLLSVRESWLPRDSMKSRLEVVEGVSRVTGGRVFAVYGEEECGRAADALDAELSAQYFIGYYPDSTPGTEFKEIRLEVGGSRLQARTRSGYYPPR